MASPTNKNPVVKIDVKLDVNNELLVTVKGKKYKISVYKVSDNSEIDVHENGNKKKWKEIAAKVTEIALRLQEKDFQEADIVLSGIPSDLEPSNNQSKIGNDKTTTKSSSPKKTVTLISSEFKYIGETGKSQKAYTGANPAPIKNKHVNTGLVEIGQILNKKSTDYKITSIDDLAIKDLKTNSIDKCIAYNICKKNNKLNSQLEKDISDQVATLRKNAANFLNEKTNTDKILNDPLFFHFLINEINENGAVCCNKYKENHENIEGSKFTEDEISYISSICIKCKNSVNFKTLMNNEKQKTDLISFYSKSISQKLKNQEFIHPVGITFLHLHSKLNQQNKTCIIEKNEIIFQSQENLEIDFNSFEFIDINNVNEKLQFSPINKHKKKSKKIIDEVICKKRNKDLHNFKLNIENEKITNGVLANNLIALTHQNKKFATVINELALKDAKQLWEQGGNKGSEPGTVNIEYTDSNKQKATCQKENYGLYQLDLLINEAYSKNDGALRDTLKRISGELFAHIDDLAAVS